VAGIRRVADLVEDIMLALRPQEARPRFAKNGNVAAAGNPHAGADNAGNTPKLTGPTLGIMPDYGDEKEGILVSGVTDGRPAAKAGILRDDRIVELAGKPVKNMAAYMTILNSLKKGEKVEVTVIRKGEQKKIAVQLD
jgi:S1-C subfamily serine protease